MDRPTVDDLSEALGGDRVLAEAGAVGRTAVANWRKRGIPPSRWTRIVKFAAALGVDGITLEYLASLGRSSRLVKRAPSGSAAPAGQAAAAAPRGVAA